MKAHNFDPHCAHLLSKVRPVEQCDAVDAEC